MILLDLIRAAMNPPYKLIEERDRAVTDYAVAQSKFLQAERHKKKLRKELAVKSKQLEQALAANLELEALLAMHGTDAEEARREAWMAWSERLLNKANEQADLAGKRVLALEAWVTIKGGDRDAIYAAAGLERVGGLISRAVAPVDEDEAAAS